MEATAVCVPEHVEIRADGPCRGGPEKLDKTGLPFSPYHPVGRDSIFSHRSASVAPREPADKEKQAVQSNVKSEQAVPQPDALKERRSHGHKTAESIATLVFGRRIQGIRSIKNWYGLCSLG